jgi:hypothetical protein
MRRSGLADDAIRSEILGLQDAVQAELQGSYLHQQRDGTA